MTPTLENLTPRPATPETPTRRPGPETDPLREVGDEILVDCRIRPKEYLRESEVPGGCE
jgi:hypothetical protein